MKTANKSLLCMILLLLSLSEIHPVATALPTFDFTNFTQAVESLVKAINFYNTIINQAKQTINRIEKISQGLSQGDFKSITSSITDILNLVNDVDTQILKIIEYSENKKKEAELISKKSTLEIIALITNPSIKGMKEYAQKRDFSNLSLSGQIKRIAQDAKDSIELLTKDHSDTTRKAMDDLNINLDNLSKSISSILARIDEKSEKNSQNVAALETLSGFHNRLNTLLNSTTSLQNSLRQAKNNIDDSDRKLNDEIDSWQRIINGIDNGISNTAKLNKSIQNFFLK